MNRRQFLSKSVAAGLLLRNGLPGAQTDSAGAGRSVRVTVDPKKTVSAIPSNFIGLGYEISSVATTGLLNAENRVYVQLVRTLGSRGVIRIGGNTSDYARYSRAQYSVVAPKATVVNERNLRELGTFLDATGWDLIWGLNLGRGTEQDAVEEARAVVANVKHKLLAFEIGNEPDLFRRVHREQGYGYEDYLREYRRVKAAVRKQLPDVSFAGPDVASATDWVTRFAADEGSDLKLLTHHYYRECSNPGSNFDKLLHADPKLAPELQKLKSASASSHVPYRICETNSFCGGGKPGVSDTFCSALWALDFLFTLASAGAAGLNMETGVNQLGFISSYSPVEDDEHGRYWAAPEYYGMLAFAQASRGRLMEVACDAAHVNLSAYAVIDERKRVFVTVINKDSSVDANVSIRGLQAASGSVMRLTAPSLESKDGVMLGGSTVSADGSWKRRIEEQVRMESGECRVTVPALSAAVVILEQAR